KDGNGRVLDCWSDRSPPAVVTPEVKNRKRLRAADNARVRATALRTDFALRNRNLWGAAAFLTTLCLNRFWMHRCTAHHIQSQAACRARHRREDAQATPSPNR